MTLNKLSAGVGQAAPIQPIKIVNALRLARASRSYPKPERAQDAAAWIQGGLVIHPTITLAATDLA
jgi:hypothetical protein